MVPTNRIPRIELSDEAKERLTRTLDRYIELAEEYHSQQWDALHDGYLRQYLAQPAIARRTYPWEGASNIYAPLTRVIVDGILAQEHDAMLTNDPLVRVVPVEGGDIREAELLDLFYGQYVWNTVLPLRRIVNDWLLDNSIDGTSAAKPRWNRDFTVRRTQRVEAAPVLETKDGITLVTDIEENLIEEAVIERIEEPAVDVADLGRIFVAPDSGPSFQYPECRWYYQRQYLTWDDVMMRERFGYSNIDDELKAKLNDRYLSDQERSARRQQDLNQTVEPTVELLEFYMRWPLPAKYKQGEETIKQTGLETDHQEEVIVSYWRDTKKLARVVPLARLYPDGKRPHVLMHYSRFPRNFYGLGIPGKVRQLNKLMNQLWNQMIDYGTLQNIPWYFYEPAAGTIPDLIGLRPGQGVPVQNARSVHFPTLRSDPGFWLGAMQQVQMWAERDGSVTDFNLGRQASTPNAPRTARGTMALLQQSNIAFSRLVSQHAEGPKELFRRIHALYQRFAPPEVSFRVTNQQSRAMQRQTIPSSIFQQDIDFQFEINPNRQSIMQQKMAMAQFMLAIPFIQQIPASVRELARKVYTAHGEKDFDQLWPEQMLEIQTAQAQAQAGMPPQQPQLGPAPVLPFPTPTVPKEPTTSEEENVVI